jgi:CRISPR-associated protein (TIGR02584 family)
MTHTLVSVIGMSPAVITETLYAIHKSQLSWPDQIHAITTSMGAQKLSNIVHVINQLCQDYGRPTYSDTAISVHVVPGANNEPIKDANSLEDHEALGNFIMQFICELTKNQDDTVHASIAGGRKTMTFYLGYAMSLFGRSHDQLSHVLVSEPYETVRDFYYPTPTSRQLTINHSDKTVDAADAQVILADIPFIRLRNSLPNTLSEHFEFRDTVNMINLGEEEWRERHIRLILPKEKPELIVKSKDGQIVKTVPLAAIDFAFYRTVVREMLEQNWGIGRPTPKNSDYDETDMATSLLTEILRLHNFKGNPVELMNEQMIEIIEDGDDPFQIHSRTLAKLKYPGLTAAFLDVRCNSCKTALLKVLPERLARWLCLTQVTSVEKARLDYYGSHEWPKTGKPGSYGLPLSPNSITLID